jgi:L-rhamnose mutarotase
MKLKPGFEAEYQKRHDEIWPELSQVLTDAGVADYSIFLDEATLTLFAVWKLTDDNTSADLPNHPMVKNGGPTWQISWKPIQTTHRSRSL